MLLSPFAIAGIEDLRQPAPADVSDKNRLLLIVSRLILAFKLAKQTNDLDVPPIFLLERTFTQTVGIGDAVVGLVAKRLYAGTSLSSGGSRM